MIRTGTAEGRLLIYFLIMAALAFIVQCSTVLPQNPQRKSDNIPTGTPRYPAADPGLAQEATLSHKVWVSVADPSTAPSVQTVPLRPRQHLWASGAANTMQCQPVHQGRFPPQSHNGTFIQELIHGQQEQHDLHYRSNRDRSAAQYQTLYDRMMALEALGHDLPCSYQISSELQWLIHYTSGRLGKASSKASTLSNCR